MEDEYSWEDIRLGDSATESFGSVFFTILPQSQDWEEWVLENLGDALTPNFHKFPIHPPLKPCLSFILLMPIHLRPCTLPMAIGVNTTVKGHRWTLDPNPKTSLNGSLMWVIFALRPCSVAKNFAKWLCSTFRCYLTISVQSWSN
jgi:hypothetical protein